MAQGPFDTDITVVRTGDGSHTLHHAQLNEPYHSLHGAVQESTHVFIRAGLEATGSDPVRVLEVGLGTGLNLLLTWVRCMEGKCRVDYTALETFPLSEAQLVHLGHCEQLAWPGLQEGFLTMMTGPEGMAHDAEGGLRFTRLATPVQQFTTQRRYDVIYFDAFAPEKQPDMWTPEVFRSMHDALVPGGVLVTYCAKGQVRRDLIATGFQVERLQGPPGKREMLRATRPRS